MSKIKLYKDPSRAQQKAYTPYSPVYKRKGVVPTEIFSGHVSPEHVPSVKSAEAMSLDNPRTRPAPKVRTNIVMPYADLPMSIQPIGQGQMPNSGNNMENSWVSVDGEDFDDVVIEEGQAPHRADLDPNHPMIDNNLDDQTNYQHIPAQIKAAPQPNFPQYSVDVPDEEKEQSSFAIGDDQYLLVVGDSILGVNTLDIIQEEVRQLVFGEHPLNQMNNITPDDIIVLKRVKIKVGVFLE